MDPLRGDPHFEKIVEESKKPVVLKSLAVAAGFDMPRHTQSATRSVTRSFTAGSHNAVIRVCDAAGNVIHTHEHA